MKTIQYLFYIVCLTAVVLCWSGCSDFLERNHPTGVTDDDFWKTMNECESALSACKRWPHGTYHYTSPNISWVHMEGMTDNMYFMSNFQAEVINIGNGTVTPTSGGYIAYIWINYYEMIRRCNRFLENVEKAYFTDESERLRMIAEARVWRAWYHMQLLMIYGWDDGIPVVEESLNPADIYRPRNTVEECLAFINRELDAIINSSDLPFIWDESRRSRMSQSVALVLKMDVNLQFHQYDQVKAATQKIIDSGEFSLYYSDQTDEDSGKHYRDMFRYIGQQNRERILFTSSGLNEAFFRNMGVSLGGQGTAAPLKSLIDTYETIDGYTLDELTPVEKLAFEKDPLYKERDPRLYTSIMLPGDDTSLFNYIYEPFDPESADYVGANGASRSGYMLKKFIDENDRASRFGSLDYPLYRYAEVLLSHVEALVESGDWQHADVEKYINMIRNRAGMPDMDKSRYNTQEKVRELYRRERRVELCYEGKRYFDIRRWGIGTQTMTGRAEGAWNPITNAFVVIEERNCSFPKNNSFPLPQVEVTSNPNISQPIGW